MAPKTLDQETAKNLIDEWEAPIFGLAYSWLRNEADAADASQEIFMVILRDLPQLRSQDKRPAWIGTTARRVLTRFKSRRQKRLAKEHSVSELEAESGDTPEAIRDRDRVIHNAIAALPDELRSAIEIHFFMGLSQREAATVLELPRTTIQARISKGLEQLRPSLAASAALTPNLENLLRGLAIKPPPSLRPQLFQLCEPGADLAAFTKGGLLMKAKSGAAIVVVTSLSVIGGVSVGAFINKTRAHTSRSSPSDLTPRQKVEATSSAQVPATTGETRNARAKILRLRHENSALQERLAAARRAITKIEADQIQSKTPLGTRNNPAQDAFKDAKKHALAGDFIAFRLGRRRAERLPSHERDQEYARLNERYSAMLQVALAWPEALGSALVDRLVAGDPPMDDLARPGLISLAYNLPLNPESQAVLRDHIQDVLRSKDSSKDLKRELLSQYPLFDPKAPDTFFRHLLENIDALEDPAILQDAGRALAKLGAKGTPSALRNLAWDETRPAALRAGIIAGLPRSSVGDNSELILTLTEHDLPRLRRAAFLRLTDLPKSRRGRIAAQKSLDSGALSLKEAKPALVHHGDASTIDRFLTIAHDQTRPLAERDLAREAARQLRRALAIR